VLEKQIETEDIVFDTVKTHLTSKRDDLMVDSGARDKLRESEIEKLDLVLKDIKDESDLALENIEVVTRSIDLNRKERENEKKEEDYKAELE